MWGLRRETGSGLIVRTKIRAPLSISFCVTCVSLMTRFGQEGRMHTSPLYPSSPSPYSLLSSSWPACCPPPGHPPLHRIAALSPLLLRTAGSGCSGASGAAVGGWRASRPLVDIVRDRRSGNCGLLAGGTSGSSRIEGAGTGVEPGLELKQRTG
ncbi:hypothetical protein Vretimale_16529 [Volvox reticuliferus]|uniref:Uncharacterized protein n=1 Tax=Volvox reticuliferus TaxID=1737510 RepID=A0A8J4GT35_9CHLO|nr:hypothetical protein Vretimale_16529 [Volvox reticuliferus]